MNKTNIKTKNNQITKLDRILMLLLVLIAAIFLLRPLVSIQGLERAKLYSDQALHKEAISHLKKSIFLESENAPAWSLLAYSYSKIGRKKKAISAYNKTLKLNPEDIQAVVGLSLIYFYEQNYKKSTSVLEKYLEPEKSHVDGWMLLATCYEKIDKQKKAQQTWKLIYEKIDPGNVVAESKLK